MIYLVAALVAVVLIVVVIAARRAAHRAGRAASGNVGAAAVGGGWAIGERLDEPVRRSASVGERLELLAAQRGDYVIYVGVPSPSPTRWARTTSVGDHRARLEDGSDVPLADVRAFVVAYPNGDLLEQGGPSTLRLPKGVTDPKVGPADDGARLTPADWAAGATVLRVAHDRPTRGADGKRRYRTSVTNVSSEPVRVLKFGAYQRTSTGYALRTITGAFFSSGDFREWYGLGDREWIEPGGSVADDNNYGEGSLWAYFGETESGQRFLSAGEAP